MSEHGFMQPNPGLLDLEQRKKKSGLAHELGLGAACTKCGDGCSGFELHFWRKVCINCRCGKAEHNVRDEEDYGFVGKIFDRPLRTKAEERKFIFGDVFEENQDTAGTGANAEVVLDWAPPGVSNSLASKYLRSLPEGHVSIQGSDGAVRRKKQLEKQFPLHDVEPDHCHQLSEGEMESMSSYVNNVKENVVGQGTLQELGIGRTISHHVMEDEFEDPPPPLPSSIPPIYSSVPQFEDRDSPPLPPPPMDLLDLETLTQSLQDIEHGRHSTVHDDPKYGFTQENSVSSYPSSINGNSQHPKPGSSVPRNTFSSNSGGQKYCEGLDAETPLSSGLSKLVRSGWTCSGCGDAMFPGDVAIFAERTGEDRCWHPSCFSCTQCGEMLEDLLYYHHKGALYCGRDYAELMKIPRCSACDELIFSAEYTGAEDSFWHVKHFCCWLCDSPLAGQKYIPVAGQPHCLPCWQARHGKECQACRQYIDPQGQRVTLGDKHWHASPSCFKCGVCEASLLGGKMSRKHGTLLCSSQCGQVLADRVNHMQGRVEDNHMHTSVYKVSDL